MARYSLASARRCPQRLHVGMTPLGWLEKLLRFPKHLLKRMRVTFTMLLRSRYSTAFFENLGRSLRA